MSILPLLKAGVGISRVRPKDRRDQGRGSRTNCTDRQGCRRALCADSLERERRGCLFGREADAASRCRSGPSHQTRHRSCSALGHLVPLGCRNGRRRRCLARIAHRHRTSGFWCVSSLTSATPVVPTWTIQTLMLDAGGSILIGNVARATDAQMSFGEGQSLWRQHHRPAPCRRPTVTRPSRRAPRLTARLPVSTRLPSKSSSCASCLGDYPCDFGRGLPVDSNFGGLKV